ncbi:MAG: amino acid permease [Candidatus Micrarchaeaceae archaeon]
MLSSLKKVLSLTDAIMINLGAIIGAGIFVIIGIAAGAAGPSIVISIVIGAIISIFTGLSFSEIASHVAKEGGVYEYAKDALAPFAGFLGGWLWSFGNMIAVAAVSLSLGGYINSLLGFSLNEVYYAVAAVLIFMTVNILGIKNSAKTIRLLVMVNVAILAVFIAIGSFFFHPSHFANFEPNGLKGMLTGSAIIFFAFTGFSRVTTVGSEVKNAERVIPRAIIASIIISSIIYIAVALVAVGLVPYGELANSKSPLSTAIGVTNIPVLGAIIAIGGIAATAGVVLTGILGVSRVFFAMGRDNELPKKLSKLDRFSTPINSIVVASIVSIAFIIAVSFETIVEASNVATLSAYAIINIAALKMWLKLRKKLGKAVHLREQKYFALIPIFGFLSIVAIMAYLSVASLLIVLGILAIGVAYYAYKSLLASKGVEHAISRAVPIISEVREFGRSRVEKG